MTTTRFDAWANRLLGSGALSLVDFDADTIRIIGVDTADDTPSIATDDVFDDILAAARIGNSGGSARGDGAQLLLPTIGTLAPGIFDADDTVMTSVVGDQFEAVVMYKDTGADATSPLIVLYESSPTVIPGLPVLPNGNDVTFVWSTSGIISI
jgi:hypothetical protein